MTTFIHLSSLPTHRRLSLVHLILCIVALGHHSYSNAGVMCPDHIQTPLEDVYCQLITTSFGKTLPNEADFRKNNEQIQRILLKAPAKKAGIKLPKAANKKHSPPAVETQTPFLVKKQQRETFTPSKHCRAIKSIIDCTEWGQFQLQLNRPPEALSKLALTEDNKMLLQDYEGDPEDHTKLAQHLSAQYEIYLKKMNSIGLAESILSWQKFTTIFFATIKTDPPINQKQSFAKRFEIMFETLKKDKSALLSPSATPLGSIDLKECAAVGLQLMVCQIRNRSYLFEAK